MAIREWPEAERPREKLIKAGAAALSDAELLAIFLRTGIPGLTAVDLARRLLLSFGGLRGILEADFQSFSAQPGLGLAKYAQLQAILEMAHRHLAERMQNGVEITSPDVTREFLSVTMRAYQQEVFACLYLDSQHRLIHFHTHFFGTVDGASVYPRELVKTALKHNAAAVILAHNHPSGVAEPSRADQTITRGIQSALELVDVRVLDHMIVGDGEVISFAERGLI
ncbi:MAG: DNA repair protein RadC [Pseudomonadales bacterium]|nr:DNA repair protein RadC [Pseudomonadales bacterium]MCP5213577.1 DNA repair protein RadC [Pseudomonadales bacterium]